MSNLKIFSSVFFLIFLILFLDGCQSQLTLKKIELNKELRINDTVTQYHDSSLLVVNIRDFGKFGLMFGDFTPYCGFIRNFGSNSLIYEANDFDSYRVSEKYFAEVSPEYRFKLNWGWYNIDEKGGLKPLPNEKKILDSLEKHYSSDYFLTTIGNGLFLQYKKGKLIQKYNYGNLIMNERDINFDTLEYGLYKIVNNKLVNFSGDPDEIFQKGPGIFYVPSPGLGVIRKYKLADIDRILMSYNKLSDCPSEIQIESVK